MARPKGGKNRKWTNEERLKYVLMCEEEHIPVCTIVREEGISRGTLREWIRRYRSGGEEALNPEKLHPGNHFSALQYEWCIEGFSVLTITPSFFQFSKVEFAIFTEEHSTSTAPPQLLPGAVLLIKLESEIVPLAPNQ